MSAKELSPYREWSTSSIIEQQSLSHTHTIPKAEAKQLHKTWANKHSRISVILNVILIPKSQSKCSKHIKLRWEIQRKKRTRAQVLIDNIRTKVCSCHLEWLNNPKDCIPVSRRDNQDITKEVPSHLEALSSQMSKQFKIAEWNKTTNRRKSIPNRFLSSKYKAITRR